MGRGSHDRIGTFGKGNSGSKYRVDKVCNAANSADHNHRVPGAKSEISGPNL